MPKQYFKKTFTTFNQKYENYINELVGKWIGHVPDYFRAKSIVLKYIWLAHLILKTETFTWKSKKKKNKKCPGSEYSWCEIA